MASDPPATAPRWQRVFVIATAATVGWCLAYALADWGGWHRLTYDSHRGTWSWPTGPTPRVPINYYGGLLWGAGGAALGAAIAALAIRAWRRPVPAPVIALLGAWALTGFALTGAYYTWMLWPF